MWGQEGQPSSKTYYGLCHGRELEAFWKHMVVCVMGGMVVQGRGLAGKGGHISGIVTHVTQTFVQPKHRTFRHK